MMNVPNYPQCNQTQTQMPAYTQPNVTVPMQPHAQLVYPKPVCPTGVCAHPTCPHPAAPQVDKSMTEAVLRTDVVAEYAAIVNLNAQAVNLAKQIEECQDQAKKARLETLFNNVNMLIVQHENRANMLDAQADYYKS